MKKKQVSRIVNKVSKMTLSLLMVAMATLTFVVPIEIEAAVGDKKELMLGDTGVEHIRNATPYDSNLSNAWDGDYLYWGKGGAKWQILNKQSTEFKNSGMLILSGNLGEPSSFGGQVMENYDGSVLDTYLTTKYTEMLSPEEQSVTLGSTNENESIFTSHSAATMGANAEQKERRFANKKWFAPTGYMMYEDKYGFSNIPLDKDKARTTNSDTTYWLSSITKDYQGFISSGNMLKYPLGAVYNEGYFTGLARPCNSRAASVLNPNSILFVSKANGGKSRAVVSSELAQISATTNNEWKFTLKDSGQTISDMKVKRTSLENVEITFDKNGQGTNLSAVVTDASGANIMNYGRVSSLTSGSVNDATATIKLPADFFAKNYKLKVFTEKYTNETATDYASDLMNVSVPAFEVDGTYEYRKSDGVLTSEKKTYVGGQKFTDLVKPIPPNPVAGYRLSDSANPWIITPTTIDPTNIVDNFTATAQYTKTHKVKLYTGLDSSITYFDGTVDEGRNIGIDGVDGSSIDGKSKVEVKSPLPPTGYRFDKWEYSKFDGYDFDTAKASVTNVGSNFVAKAKYVKIFEVEFSDGQGNDAKNRVQVELDDGTKVDKQTIDTGKNAVVPKLKPAKPYYHFSQWNSAFDIKEDKLLSNGKSIVPVYLPYTYTLDTHYRLYAYTKEEAKDKFASLSNAEIDDLLMETYVPSVYRDGTKQVFGEEKSSEDGSYKDKVTISGVNYEELRAGNKGKFDVTFSYENKNAKKANALEKAFEDQKQVTIKIADDTNANTSARIAANDFTLSIKEVQSIWFTNVVQLASAQAYGEDGKMGVARVDDRSLESLPAKAGVYDLKFNSAVMVGGKLEVISTTVKVTVKDDSGVDEDSVEQINGNNFVITLDKVEEVMKDDAALKALGNVEATNMESGKAVAVEVSDKSRLKAELGEYIISFKTTTATKNTVLSLVVSVSDKEVVNGNEKISGNHFAMKSSEVKELLTLTPSEIEAQLIALGKVKAINSLTLNELPVSVEYSALKEKSGVYDISYTTKKGTTLVVQVSVSDGSVINGNERISASDFTMLTKEVTDVNLVNSKLIAFANAKAQNVKTGKAIDITEVTHTIIKKAGNYTVTFGTAKPTQITVNVSVRDEINEQENESISGNHFTVKTSEVATLDDHKLIVLANAKAMNMDKKVPMEVRVKESKLQSGAGQYDVTFTTGKTDLTIQATVKDEVITNDKTREVISANHFEVLLDDFDTLDSAKIIELANAKAYNIDTNEEINDLLVEHDIKARVGDYPVHMQTQKGTSVSIIASVRDQSVEANGEKVSGSNFTIKSSEANTIKEEDFITLGKVKAITMATGKNVSVKVDSSLFKTTRGVYDIVYRTEKGTTLTLKAEVVDELSENVETRETMSANSIYIGVEEVAMINDEMLKDLSKVKAYNMDDRKAVEVHKVEHNIKAEKGEYWAEFSTEKGTRIKVQVFVEASVVEDSKNKERITGNSFKIELEKAGNLSEEEFIRLARVNAVDLQTGAFVDVQVDDRDFKVALGTYDIVYSTVKGTSLTLKVNVYDESKVKERVIGNDIYLSVEEAATIEDKQLQGKAKARAIDINSDKEIEITKYENTIKAEKGIYEATFATSLGTLLVVDVYVNNENKLESSLGEQITGNKFTIRPEDVSKMDEVAIVTLGNVKAVDLDTREFVNVYVDKDALQEKEGTYTIPLTTSKDTKASIQIEVKKEAEKTITTEIPKKAEVVIQKETVVVNQEVKETAKKETKKVTSSNRKIANDTTIVENDTTKEKMQWIMYVVVALYGIYMVARIYVRKRVD